MNENTLNKDIESIDIEIYGETFEERISTTGTIRDVLDNLHDGEMIVIPIGGEVNA